MPLDIFSKADICHDRRHLCNEHSWQEIAVGFVGSVNLVSLLLVLQPLLWRLCEKDLRKCGSTSMTLINLQNLEDTQVGYILQKYTLEKYT